MRTTALLLVVGAACGSTKTNAHDDAAITAGSDATVLPIVDAPPLPACTPVSGTTMSVRKVGMVHGSAVLATSPPHDGRLFVVEQDGVIRIFENEQAKAAPFLDISQLADFH